jgi:hypothetical protein
MTRLALAVLLFGAPFVASTPALAQDECLTSFSHPEWVTEMDEIDKSLATFNLDDARLQVDATWRHVGCLSAPVQPGYLARFARQRAMLAFFDQDEDNAIKWGLLAKYTAPDMGWPVPEDHPFRQMIAEAEDPPMGGPENASLIIAKGNKVLLNGWPITEPKAHAEVPGLVQVVDKKGAVVSTYWQDGAAFPPDMIGPPGVVNEPPCFDPPKAEDYAAAGGDQSQPSTAPALTWSGPSCGGKGPKPTGNEGGGGNISIVNLAAGAGLAVIAGTTYAIALVDKGHLGDATNPDELVKSRSGANVLSFTSAGLGAAAVGVGVTAFIMDDTPGVAFGFRW